MCRKLHLCLTAHLWPYRTHKQQKKTAQSQVENATKKKKQQTLIHWQWQCMQQKLSVLNWWRQSSLVNFKQFLKMHSHGWEILFLLLLLFEFKKMLVHCHCHCRKWQYFLFIMLAVAASIAEGDLKMNRPPRNINVYFDNCQQNA